MTFDEFKGLALNPPYVDALCVYRVDMHRYINQLKDTTDVMEYEVKLCQSFMYTEWQRIQKIISQFVHHERYNEQLYALYIYQLPINTDVSDNLYQRLWVYDKNGYPHTTDVFSPMRPIRDKLRQHFTECYQHTIEHHHDQINTNRITEENTAGRIKEIRRLINLI